MLNILKHLYYVQAPANIKQDRGKVSISGKIHDAHNVENLLNQNFSNILRGYESLKIFRTDSSEYICLI